MTVHSQLQKLVVRGIAAGDDVLRDRYEFRRSHYPQQPVARFPPDQRRELWPRDHLKKLRLAHSGFQHRATLRGLIQSEVA